MPTTYFFRCAYCGCTFSAIMTQHYMQFARIIDYTDRGTPIYQIDGMCCTHCDPENEEDDMIFANYDNAYAPAPATMRCPICGKTFVTDLSYEDWIFCIPAGKLEDGTQVYQRFDLFCPECEEKASEPEPPLTPDLVEEVERLTAAEAAYLAAGGVR